jgi:hypothetical protein
MNQQMPMNLDPNTMNMMMLQFQMMNNMCNNGSNQSFNFPLMMNYEFYKIKNQNPFYDNNLSQIQKNLSLFFLCIYDFKKAINSNGTKIYINYYNLEKIELYLDLGLQLKYLISIIFGLIFANSNLRKYCIRMESSQTTKEIIENPLLFYGSDLPYKNIMYLEFNNIDLLKCLEKTGIEIGLKEGDEIFLKLKKEYYNELEALKLDYTIVLFKFDDGNIISFPSFQEEIISDMFKRFIKFINIDDKLYFCRTNNSKYSEDLKINCKKIKELSENPIIRLIKKNRLIGAGTDFKFTDVSKEKIKNLTFSNDAPKWRHVEQGLNIFGICQNKDCKAYKNEVVYIPENMDIKSNYFVFNVIEQRENMLCPICKSIIKSKTIGFYKCEYQIIGKKIEEGKLKQYDSKPKETKNDNFEYFDSNENGEVEWTRLVIYILPKQKIKYQSNQ